MNSREEARITSRQGSGKIGDSAPSVADGQPKSRDALKELARRIRVLRARHGLTQETLSARCGISVSFASLLERGARSPSYETLVRIAQALEIPMADLFGASREGSVDEPAYQRLLEFARRRRLSRGQVERWLKVGQALFDDEKTFPVAQSQPRAGSPLCQEDGCTRPVLAKRMCASHYHRARRARL